MSGSPTPSTSSSSSSTLIVLLLPPLPNETCTTTKKRPELKLDISISPYSNGLQMSGKGFIEPHRNNLPRRKRRVVTAPAPPVVDAAVEIEKTVSCTVLRMEAGPRSSIEEYLHEDFGTADTHEATTTLSPPIQTKSSTSPSSSSIDTNITEPPSSIHASPTAPFNNKPSTTTNTPKRASLFKNYADSSSSLVITHPITPTKGHLQPTSATLPRRHRSLVAVRERELRRRSSIADQQTSDLASRKPNDAWKEVGSHGQRMADADTMDLEIQNTRRTTQSMCLQELAKGVTLGFLIDGDDRDVQIKIYDDSPLSSLVVIPNSPSPELHLQLSLPTDPSSYTDGTTSLTDSQIQQACTFIDNHLSIPEPSSNPHNNTGAGRAMSVLILSPRMRPEEAMSIGVSYLAGMVKNQETVINNKGDEESNDHYLENDHSYSTVHQLLIAFHDDDDPGSPPITTHHHQPQPQPQILSFNNQEPTTHSLARHGGGGGSWRGLRPEWRGVLSFDGIERLDGVWTSTR